MRQDIETFIKRSGMDLTKGSLGVLEALLSISEGEDVSATGEALRQAIEQRQGKPLSADSYRQRLSRLSADLEKAAAPFRLVSNKGMVTAQPNLEADTNKRVGEQLSEHSNEKTLTGATNRVPPEARPEGLTVMYSYARLHGKLGRIQVKFFEELEFLLKYPPASYKGPAITLWRDEQKTRSAQDSVQDRLDDACKMSFLGLLMMSNKYPGSEYCMREADCFLTEDGERRPGKFCLIVPLNTKLKDAPERFHKRIWMPIKGHDDLLHLWERGDAVHKRDFVRSVADEIWDAASGMPNPISAGPTAPDKRERGDDYWLIETHAATRSYQHSCENKAPIFVQEGRMSRGLSDAPETASPDAGRIEIVPHLVEWSADLRGQRLVAVLGDFGMGKTVACQLLTQNLLKKHKEDPNYPLPIYLDLRDVDRPEEADHAGLETLIGQMLRRSGECTPSGAEVIRYARSRDALIVFDGLDEVTNKLNQDQAIRLYRELLSIVPAEVWRDDLALKKGEAPKLRGPRIVISCRTHYFKDLAAQRSFFAGQDRERISPDEQIKTYYLMPFTMEQIETYLGFHFDKDETAHALALIQETYNLQELAQRPVFLDFIRQTIGRIEQEKRAGRVINIARLYDIFIEQSLERDNPKHVLSVREKKRLLAALALNLHKKRSDALSVDALEDWFDETVQRFPKLRRALEGGESLSNAERFLQDLRNASFLIRPGSEEFRFGHTSVREYFLANAIHQAICDGAIESLDVPPVSRETISFLLARQAAADADAQRAFLKAFPSLLEEARPPALRSLGFAIWLASETRLPRPAVMDLSGLDFSRQVLRGTKGRLLPLSRTLWRGTKLRQTEFDHVALDDADFISADAAMSKWLTCRLSGAKWNSTLLRGSHWRGDCLDVGALNGSALQDARVFACRLGPADWRRTEKPNANRWETRCSLHSGDICAVALGRIGGRDVAVSGGFDGTVRLWDAESGQSLTVLEGHNNSVRSVALGRIGDRDVAISGGGDGTVRLWDAESGQSLAVLEGHEGEINAVALGRIGDRDVAISGGDDGTVRLWYAESGQSLAVLEGHEGEINAVALGRIGGRDVAVSGGDDGTVRLWDAESGQSLAVLEGHKGYVLSVALGRIGGRDVAVSGGDDGTVRLWDAESGQSLTVLEGHKGYVLSVALGRIGGRDVAVSGGNDGTVRLWDAESGQSLAVLEGHKGYVWSVALGRIGGRDVAVSGGGDGTVRLWDAESGQSLTVLEGHNDSVRSVALGRIGGRDVAVSGGDDGTVRLWDAKSGQSLTVLEGHKGYVRSVALGRIGGRDVAVSGGDDGTVRLWDAESGQSLAVLEGHKGYVRSVALGRIGGRDVAVSGGDDGTVRLWDAKSGQSLTVPEGRNDFVRSVALGRIGGRDVAVSGGDDGTVRLWDAESGQSLAVLEGHKGYVWSVALGRIGGRDVAVSGGFDGTVRLWDAESGQSLAVLEGHKGYVLSVALGRIGGHDVAVSGGADGTVRLWDAKSGQNLAVLEGHASYLLSVALGQVDGRDVVVSGGYDGTVRLWDIREAPTGVKALLRLILGPTPSAFLQLVPDGAGDYRIARSSPDAWRFFIAKGWTPEGRMVMAPIEEMMEPGALASALAAAREG